MDLLRQKGLQITGAIYFILYFMAAILYFKERIFLDGAYYFFHVVQSQGFWVEHQRFILIASQLLTWFGVKLHLSLQTVMILNSINPACYLLGIFIICVFVLKDETAGWMLLFIGVCGVYFLYFVPMYEVWYGAVLLVLFSSMLQNEIYHKPAQLLLMALVVIALLFSYPLMIFGFVFFTAFHFAGLRKVSVKLLLLFGLIVAGWLVWKTLFLSDYENGKISYPFSRIGTTLKENFSPLGNVRSLFNFLFTVYGEAMVMWLITLILLVVHRYNLKAILLFTFVAAFIFMINITHSYPWHHSNYFERMYLLLVPMCMLPFLRSVYFISKKKVALMGLFILIIIFRGSQIFQHTTAYRERINEIEAFIKSAQTQQGSKFYVAGEDYPGNAALDEWSFPMEVLLYSSLQTPDHTVTISLRSDLEAEDVQALLNDRTFHLRLNEVRDDAWLNQKYFHIKDGNYIQLMKR